MSKRDPLISLESFPLLHSRGLIYNGSCLWSCCTSAHVRIEMSVAVQPGAFVTFHPSRQARNLQYRHLFAAPVDLTSASAWLLKLVDNISINKPNILMIHVACESKPRSVVRSSLHPCPGNWVAIRRAVAFYARAAHLFSAEINCRHCRARFRRVILTMNDWC